VMSERILQILRCHPAYVVFLFNNPTFKMASFHQRVALRNDSQTDNVSPGKKGTGMLLDLLGGRRVRLLYICQATVPALLILITIVSCSGPPANMPPPIAEIVELFSGGVTETPKQQLVQRDEPRTKVRRPASKKANATPAPDAQREQQLYQEFLEWRSQQKDKQ
jgi:hypothetical protein